jgi:hypothetical protein
MHYLLGKFRVEDLGAWKRTMEEHRPHHLAAGMRFERVWSVSGDPAQIYFLFAVDDVEKARASLSAAGALDQAGQRAGEIPEMIFLEER